MNLPSADIKDYLLSLTDIGDLLLENGFEFLLENGEGGMEIDHESLQNITLRFAGNFHIGNEPAKPRKVITIFDYSIAGPDLTLKGFEGLEHVGIQIRVRDKYKEAYRISEGIMEHLHGKSNVIVGGSSYAWIECNISPTLLDWIEPYKLCRFTTSYHLHRQIN